MLHSDGNIDVFSLLLLYISLLLQYLLSFLPPIGDVRSESHLNFILYESLFLRDNVTAIYRAITKGNNPYDVKIPWMMNIKGINP